MVTFRAKRLEKLLDTPARIYYKYEGGSPAGSHKPNSAVPQAWYNKMGNVKNVVTETGAGQWGSALSFACSLFGLNCEVNVSVVYVFICDEGVHPPRSRIFSAGMASSSFV